MSQGTPHMDCVFCSFLAVFLFQSQETSSFLTYLSAFELHILLFLLSLPAGILCISCVRGKTLICSWAWLGLKFTFACMLSCFSGVGLFVSLSTTARQTPLSMEFFRQEYCSGQHCPSPGDISDPGIEPGSPALQAGSLSSEPPSTLIVLIFRNSCQIYFSSPSQLLS